MTTRLHEIHFTEPAAFLEELAADCAASAIEDGIVRLAVVTGPTETLPERIAQTCYVEASYLSARGQMVKLSLFACWRWTGAEVKLHGAKGKEHNDGADLLIRQVLLSLQAPLQRIEGIELRGGSLVESHRIWTPAPFAEVSSPDPLVCRLCGEALYWANAAWRAKSTRKAEALVEVPCDACEGSGQSRAGRLCMSCQGSKVTRKVDHEHEPEAVPLAEAVAS